MDSIKELVERHGHKITGDGVINLGWQNGWRNDTIDLHRKLFSQAQDDSYTRSGPASWQIFKFKIVEGEKTYTVTYTLDSGD